MYAKGLTNSPPGSVGCPRRGSRPVRSGQPGRTGQRPCCQWPARTASDSLSPGCCTAAQLMQGHATMQAGIAMCCRACTRLLHASLRRHMQGRGTHIGCNMYHTAATVRVKHMQVRPAWWEALLGKMMTLMIRERKTPNTMPEMRVTATKAASAGSGQATWQQQTWRQLVHRMTKQSVNGRWQPPAKLDAGRRAWSQMPVMMPEVR